MSKYINYFLIAIVAFFTGVVSASGIGESNSSTAQKITLYINEAHAQVQAY